MEQSILSSSYPCLVIDMNVPNLNLPWIFPWVCHPQFRSPFPTIFHDIIKTFYLSFHMYERPHLWQLWLGKDIFDIWPLSPSHYTMYCFSLNFHYIFIVDPVTSLHVLFGDKSRPKRSTRFLIIYLVWLTV